MELVPGSHPSIRKAAYAEAFEPVLSLACAVLGALRWGSGLQPGGKLTPQSTWPDAAQKLGTGTGGTAVTGPAGLGAVPDALEKLLPQGPEAQQPGRVHPVESSVETSCQADRNLVWDGNQPVETGRRKTESKQV